MATHIFTQLYRDIDVLLQLILTHQSLPWTTIAIHHVKAHQDDTQSFETLSRPAQLNVMADSIATQVLDQQKPPPTYPLPAARIHLIHEDTIITSRPIKTLRYAKAETRLREYLCNRFDWSTDEFYSIDWLSYGRARASQHAASTLFTTKLLIGWLPTLSRLSKYDPKVDPTCPICQKQPETSDHPW